MNKRKKTILFFISFFVVVGGIVALDYFGVIEIPFLPLSLGFTEKPSETWEQESVTFTVDDGREFLDKGYDCSDCYATGDGNYLGYEEDTFEYVGGAAGCEATLTWTAPTVDEDVTDSVTITAYCDNTKEDSLSASLDIKDYCPKGLEDEVTYYCSGNERWKTTEHCNDELVEDCDDRDGWTGSTWCSGGDVYRNWEDAWCEPTLSPPACDSSKTGKKYEDCGTDSCTSWGSRYCSGGDVYKKRTCYDRGCSGGSCYEHSSTETKLVERCGANEECTNGECVTAAKPKGTTTLQFLGAIMTKIARIFGP